MNKLEPSDGEFIVIKSDYPLTPEQHQQIRRGVKARLDAGEPIVLDTGLRLEVRRVLPTILKSEHYARVNELLESANRYQERYRTAEAKLRELGVSP